MSRRRKIGLYLDGTSPAPKFVNEDLFIKLDGTDGEEYANIMNDIIMNNLKLVHLIIRKKYKDINGICGRYRIMYEDVFSSGYFGLVKAANTFDLDKGYKFVTYASMCISNELGMYMRTLRNRTGKDISLDILVHNSKNGDKDVTLEDILPDSHDYIDELVHSEFGLKVSQQLGRKLKPRELEILFLYAQDRKMTQQVIADKMGISRPYVAKILASAQRKAKEIYDELKEA